MLIIRPHDKLPAGGPGGDNERAAKCCKVNNSLIHETNGVIICYRKVKMQLMTKNLVRQ